MTRYERVRLALAGCGRVAGKHLEAIGALGDTIELVGVCDIDPDARAAAERATGARSFASLEAMLEATRPELVSLATPSALHPEQAVAAARAGCHVMTEKPMATRWSEALRMVRACEDAGRHLFVIKQLRHHPLLRLLAEAIEQRRFGRIYMCDVRVFWTRPQAYYDSADWRGTWEYDGGALMNQASHYVDLLTWLVGPIESVHAFGATLARNIEVEDTTVLGLRWRSGALGSMSVTMLTYPHNFEASLTILGERGTVKLGGVACDRVEQWQFEHAHPDDAGAEAARVAEAERATPATLRAGHRHVYADAVRVLRDGGQPCTDGREGLKSLEVIIAAYRSAREDRRVALPFEL